MSDGGDRGARVVQLVSGAVLVFLAGVLVSVYGLFPFPLLQHQIKAWSAGANNKPMHLVPIRYKNPGTTVHDAAAMAPGVTLLTNAWPAKGKPGAWTQGVRIIDAAGHVLHEYQIDPMALWPENPHRDPFLVRSPGSYIHGSYLFPNGDLLFNLEYIGLHRIDACGKLIWKLPARTHHSISLDDDGTFWVPSVKHFESLDAQTAAFPLIKPPFVQETALQVSADGKVLREIDLMKALFDGGYSQLPMFERGMDDGVDITHTNDVEPLSSTIAAKFPRFATGDLLISMRNISALFVMDRQGHIKWLTTHDLSRQHDPDFEPDGRIVLFNNRPDGTDLGLGNPQGSQIAAFDLITDTAQVVYPKGSAGHFYSLTGGKHQLLPNGNRLITEARAGRAFEIDPGGKLLWEWMAEPIDGNQITELLEATRYPIDAKTVSGWACPPTPAP